MPCQRHFFSQFRRRSAAQGRSGNRTVGFYPCRSGLGRIVSFAFEVNVKLREGDFDIMFGK